MVGGILIVFFCLIDRNCQHLQPCITWGAQSFFSVYLVFCPTETQKGRYWRVFKDQNIKHICCQLNHTEVEPETLKMLSEELKVSCQKTVWVKYQITFLLVCLCRTSWLLYGFLQNPCPELHLKKRRGGEMPAAGHHRRM